MTTEPRQNTLEIALKQLVQQGQDIDDTTAAEHVSFFFALPQVSFQATV